MSSWKERMAGLPYCGGGRGRAMVAGPSCPSSPLLRQGALLQMILLEDLEVLTVRPHQLESAADRAQDRGIGLADGDAIGQRVELLAGDLIAGGELRGVVDGYRIVGQFGGHPAQTHLLQGRRI